MNKHGRKRMSESEKVAEAQNFWSKTARFQEGCVNKWSKNTIGGLDLVKLHESNPAKARRVAAALQMQEKALQRINETTMSTAFGNAVRPETVLKSVYIGTANSKRGDIFTEMPLQSTDDALIYINAVREDALRGSTAGDKIYETINQYYAGETYEGAVGTGNGALTNFVSAPVSPLPIIPYSVRILVNGALAAQDFGTGVLAGASLNSALTNTVDYATGVITLNFTAAPAAGAVIKVVFNWNSELSTNFAQYGKVTLELFKKRFNARPMPLGYSFTDMTQIMFETTGIGNFDEMVSKAVGDAHAMDRDYRAIALARQIALSNPQYSFDTDFATAGEISYKSHAQRVLNEIGKVGTAIYDDIKRGGINKIVAGAKATNYLKNHDLWKDDTADIRSGVYQSGMLSDIDVFTCPAETGLIGSDEMLLTYKNPQEGLDISIVFGNLTEIDASLRYPQFYTEGYTATVEDKIVVNSKFIRLMKLDSL